jgi:hypothetical protein
VLGLERNVDAGVSDARDAAPDAPPRICLSDDFDGVQLDMTKWEKTEAPGITITTTQNLAFVYSVTATSAASANIRSIDTFNLSGNAVEALLDLRPMLTTETSLAVTNATGASLYEMRITPSDRLRLLVNGTQVQEVALSGNFLRIKFVGNSVVFGSGTSAGTYTETTSMLAMPVATAKVQITGGVTAVLGSPIQVRWDNIRVTCP